MSDAFIRDRLKQIGEQMKSIRESIAMKITQPKQDGSGIRSGEQRRRSRTETKWTRHLSEFRKSHPGLSLKACMQQAGATYHK